MFCKIKLKIDKTDWKVKRQKPTYIIVNGLYQMCCKNNNKKQKSELAHTFCLCRPNIPYRLENIFSQSRR